MKIIVLGDELDRSHSYEFKLEWLYWAAAALGMLLLALLVTFWIALDRGQRIEKTQAELDQMQESLLHDQHQLDSFYTYADTIFNEHAKKAGELQARISRLEALGGRLADMADFNDEFDFYSPPAFGGPDESVEGNPEVASMQDNLGQSMLQTDVLATLDHLSSHLEKREHELKAIESLLENNQLNRETYLAGKPIESGWLSSNFGKRIDPFHGRVAWHSGVDFAGKEGGKILAVASGVVTWSGDRYGYGEMVEIDHGNGFRTRYAHNKENLVALGDVVNKGQTIGKMGSSGRSTGPHVHFEVIKNGKAVDPARYIYRKTL